MSIIIIVAVLRYDFYDFVPHYVCVVGLYHFIILSSVRYRIIFILLFLNAMRL